MPVMPCSKDGERGWKWGEGGVCFVGPGAKEKAEAVGRAVKAREESESEDSDDSNGNVVVGTSPGKGKATSLYE